jgi:hypothetical protein
LEQWSDGHCRLPRHPITPFGEGSAGTFANRRKTIKFEGLPTEVFWLSFPAPVEKVGGEEI